MPVSQNNEAEGGISLLELAIILAKHKKLILGFPLPDSCRSHSPHWYSYAGSAVARAIIDAGWHAANVNLSLESVTFVPGPPARRS